MTHTQEILNHFSLIKASSLIFDRKFQKEMKKIQKAKQGGKIKAISFHKKFIQVIFKNEVSQFKFKDGKLEIISTQLIYRIKL